MTLVRAVFALLAASALLVLLVRFLEPRFAFFPLRGEDTTPKDCGLPFEEACLRFYESERPVRTPSAEQVRQPIYDRSVGHWRHYKKYLGELIDVLEPIRDRYRRYEPAALADG